MMSPTNYSLQVYFITKAPDKIYNLTISEFYIHVIHKTKITKKKFSLNTSNLELFVFDQ